MSSLKSTQTSTAQRFPGRAAHPYIPTYRGWWYKTGVYTFYMARELTAIGVALLALEWIVDLWALGSGPNSWLRWLDILRHPLMIATNIVILMLLVFHAVTWFEILPKTIPPVYFRGERLSERLIANGGQAVLLLITLLAVVYIFVC